MTHVEAQSDKVRIGRAQQPLHLGGGLYKGAGVRMIDHRAPTGLRLPRHLVDQIQRAGTTFSSQPRHTRLIRAARPPDAFLTEVVGKNQDVSPGTTQRVQTLERLVASARSRSARGTRQRGVDFGDSHAAALERGPERCTRR